jgi:DNA-binding beta-propeller fold protein YncE
LRELERHFPEELAVIGVHSPKFPAERDSASLRAAVQRLDLHHPVVNDADQRVWQEYAVRAWPTLMFVDPAGRVFGKHEGEFPLEPVRDLIAEAIAEYDAAGLLRRGTLALDPLPAGGGGLRFPGKVLADAAGDRLFIADTGHHRIVVTDLDGRAQTVIGSGEAGLADGPIGDARFNGPQGLALGPDGRLYVADTENHAVRAIDLGTGQVTTVAGTGEQGYDRSGGPARETALSSPWDLAFFADRLWVAMAGTHQLWALDLASGLIEAAAGTGAESIHDGPLREATFAQPSGLSAHGGVLYVADSETSAVRRVDPAANRVRRLVGRGLFVFGDQDGTGDMARLQHPLGVAATTEGGGPVVYVADAYNSKIKRLDPTTRTIASLAGRGGDDAERAFGHADGAFADALFWEPGGLSLAGRRLYVADTNNHAVRVLDLDQRVVKTVAIQAEPSGRQRPARA